MMDSSGTQVSRAEPLTDCLIRPKHGLCGLLVHPSVRLSVSERYRESLQWSYGAAVGLDDYHSFSLWDLSVCGANLQQGVLQGVAPLSAIVDTGSTCLSLPAELFDAVVSWLPVTCSDATDGTQEGQSTATAVDPSLLGGNAGNPVNSGSSSTYAADPGSASNINPHVRYCWLAADLLSGTLPTVSFRMAQSNPALADDDPLQPPKLFIPLADLIIGPPRTSATSAVEPQRSAAHNTLYRSSTSTADSHSAARTCHQLVRLISSDCVLVPLHVCRLCLYRTGSLFAAGSVQGQHL